MNDYLQITNNCAKQLTYMVLFCYSEQRILTHLPQKTWVLSELQRHEVTIKVSSKHVSMKNIDLCNLSFN